MTNPFAEIIKSAEQAKASRAALGVNYNGN